MIMLSLLLLRLRRNTVMFQQKMENVHSEWRRYAMVVVAAVPRNEVSNTKDRETSLVSEGGEVQRKWSLHHDLMELGLPLCGQSCIRKLGNSCPGCLVGSLEKGAPLAGQRASAAISGSGSEPDSSRRGMPGQPASKHDSPRPWCAIMALPWSLEKI